MKNCIPHIQTILIGVTYVKAAVISAIAAGSGFGLGWYVKGRGVSGVKVDLQNVKNDVEKLKGQFGGQVTPPVSV